jgi:threonine dehydratase
MITIEDHYGITVLRDDLLVGGTKSVLMPSIDDDINITEFVYASPVYGGFQIALSAYCKTVNKKATIVCAKRNLKHPNTLKCIEYGANIIEVEYGYLSVVEKKARDYCYEKPHIKKIVFGTKSEETIQLISNRMTQVLQLLKKRGRYPDEIWCAVGSGTLISGIVKAVPESITVIGVQVGAEFIPDEQNQNLMIVKYPKSFEKESNLIIDFPSMPNYDLKAFEMCLEYYNKYYNDKNCKHTKKNILFWNVL